VKLLLFALQSFAPEMLSPPPKVGPYDALQRIADDELDIENFFALPCAHSSE
jgi:hypothetical protein